MKGYGHITGYLSHWKWVLWNIGLIGYWISNLAWNLHHSSRSVTSKKKSRWLSLARCRQTHIDSSWCHAKTCEAKHGNHMTRDVVSWQLAQRKTFWNVFSKHLLDQLDQFEKAVAIVCATCEAARIHAKSEWFLLFNNLIGLIGQVGWDNSLTWNIR